MGEAGELDGVVPFCGEFDGFGVGGHEVAGFDQLPQGFRDYRLGGGDVALRCAIVTRAPGRR